jgi:hypothetical protein
MPPRPLGPVGTSVPSMSNNKIRYSPDIRQEYSSDDDVERGRARLDPPS